MEKKIKTALDFYIMATKLKYKIRSGWNQTHWNINKDRLESIAEHVYGTCILAISLESEFDFGIDLNKVLKMLVIHEIGETIIGDITPFDNISPEEKEAREHQAMREVLGDLTNSDELYNLLMEFDAHQTKEAKFAFMCDKMEADLQAKVYQDMGCQRSLDDQANNVVFNTPRVKQMVEEGATTAFDIWYEWDKSKYSESEEFKKILEYAKNHKLYE